MVYDDNRARQEGLELYLNETKDMRCVGTYENCSRVVEQIEELKPDVVLMDIDMPEVNGIEGLKLIRQHAPGVMIIMQTVFDEEEKIFDAIRNGANGYFLKKTAPEKLIEGIRDVMEGGAPMTASVAKKVLEVFKYQSPSAEVPKFDLTPREIEILGYLVKGLSYKMIADTCGITWHTVNFHCKKIYEKLHVHSATEAVVKAIEGKIV